MPYLRPRQPNPGIAYGPPSALLLPQRAAGVPAPPPTGTERDLNRVAGLTNLGSQVLSSIDQYLRNTDDLQAQQNLFEVTSAFQAEQLAAQVSSRNASSLMRLLQTRISAATTAAEQQRLQQDLDKWTEVERLAKEREAYLRKVAWGIGITVALALAAGGGWYYYHYRNLGPRAPA